MPTYNSIYTNEQVNQLIELFQDWVDNCWTRQKQWPDKTIRQEWSDVISTFKNQFTHKQIDSKIRYLKNSGKVIFPADPSGRLPPRQEDDHTRVKRRRQEFDEINRDRMLPIKKRLVFRDSTSDDVLERVDNHFKKLAANFLKGLGNIVDRLEDIEDIVATRNVGNNDNEQLKMISEQIAGVSRQQHQLAARFFFDQQQNK